MASLPEHSLSERDGSSNRGRHFRLLLRSPFQQVFQGRSKKGPANLALTDFDHSVKLGIPAGTRGKVGLSLTIQYKGSEKPHVGPSYLRGALPSPPTFPSDAPRKATSRLKGKPAPTPRNSPTARRRWKSRLITNGKIPRTSAYRAFRNWSGSNGCNNSGRLKLGWSLGLP